MKEGYASARSQPAASLITLVMVIGMIFAVMLTTGRTVGAEQEVVSLLDSRGTRSIVIHAEPEAGLTTDVLHRLRHIDGIEWAGGLSAVVDAHNAHIDDGVPVPVRFTYAETHDALGLPTTSVSGDMFAYASPQAANLLGLADGNGGITLSDGQDLSVVGELAATDVLEDFTPLVIVPNTPDTHADISTLVVIVDTPQLLKPVSRAVMAVVAVDDPTLLTVTTSEALAELRGVIQNQLGSFSRGLVFGLIGTMGVLLTVLLYGLVMLRRKDFGRRRALGATRTFIVGLLLIQTGILSTIGIATGVAGSLIVLTALGDPLPGLKFIVALSTLTLITSLTAASIPAIIASRRQPIRELRVP